MRETIKEMMGSVPYVSRQLLCRNRYKVRRYRLAWRFATGRLTSDEADRIRWRCQEIGGVYPLETITADDIAKSFREIYGDHPELDRLARQAAARVYRKWESCGDTASVAEDWAFDLIREYAKDEGITLPDGGES